MRRLNHFDMWHELFEIGDCWTWKHGVTTAGYGVITSGPRGECQYFYVHRVVYQRLVGPIPQGLDIDHLCCNRRCANPDHLQPVPRGENMRRGFTTERRLRALRLRGDYASA